MKATKRNLKYFLDQKTLQVKINRMFKLFMDQATQASFPDSGYYYAKKEKEMNRVYYAICPPKEARGKKTKNKRVSEKRWKTLWAHWIKISNKEATEYYDEVQTVDSTGRGWTAAEMDAAMAYS